MSDNSKNYNILIGVITKNNEKYLTNLFNTIQQYINLFADYKIFFVDGYSTDNTENIIKNWCINDPEKRKFFLQPTKFNFCQRGQSLCEARNYIIDLFRPFFNEKNLLLLLDSDSPNSCPFEEEGFLQIFKNPPDDNWVGIFPNQQKIYYDIFALRDIPNNIRIDSVPLCIENYQIEARQTGNWDCNIKYNKPHSREIKWWKVYSAFGGAALYKTKFIDFNAKYTPDEIVDLLGIIPTCEHISFNKHLTNYGSLYINTNWIIGEHE
jgi:glycosyltransferase involved in cell wall biosynthesis